MPARRGAERVGVRADLVDDVAVGADPVGAEHHRVDLAAGHQERPGAVDRDPELDAPAAPAPTRSAGRPAAAAGSRWRPRRPARRAGAARRPRPGRCRRSPRPARRCCSGSAAAAASPHSSAIRSAPRAAIAADAAISSSRTAQRLGQHRVGPSGSRAAARRAPRARFTAVGRAVSTCCTASGQRRRIVGVHPGRQRHPERAGHARARARPRTASVWIAATSSSHRGQPEHAAARPAAPSGR